MRTQAKWRSLARRVRGLWGRLPSPEEVPERTERHTALDGQLAIEAEGIVTELEQGSVERLAGPKRERNGLEAKLEPERQREAWARARLAEAEQRFVAFVARFPHAVEQLARLRKARWLFAVTVVLALASEFALTYIAVSYVAPNVSASAGLPPLIAWALSNMALIGTVGIVWATGLVTKACGREAAWAFNPLVLGPAERDAGDAAARDNPAAAVYTDRTQRSHRVAFGLLATALLGLVVGLVLLREPALALLGSLSGGSGIGGLAGSEAGAEESDGTLLLVGLFAVSAFPLFAAGWASYSRESPLPNALAALTDDVMAARKGVVTAMKRRGATEAELADIGVTMNVILAERDAGQVLARLMPHLGHEVMVEALPELFGLVTTEPHGLLGPAGKLAAPFPRGDGEVPERFPTRPDPAGPQPEPMARDGYVPPPEAAPQPNGGGPTESMWAGRS